LLIRNPFSETADISEIKSGYGKIDFGSITTLEIKHIFRQYGSAFFEHARLLLFLQLFSLIIFVHNDKETEDFLKRIKFKNSNLNNT
jgi:hypothetical protein